MKYSWLKNIVEGNLPCGDGCRGFVGTYAQRFLHEIEMSKQALRKTLKELEEGAEKGSFWLGGPVTGVAGRCFCHCPTTSSEIKVALWHHQRGNNAQQATHLCSHLSYMYYTLYSFSRILCKHTHKYKLWLLDAHFNYSSCYVIECGCVECVEFLTKRWDKFLVYGNGYRCSAKFSNLFKLIVQNASNIFASMSLEIQTCEQMGHCCFLFPLPLQRQGCRVSTWLSFPTGVEWACTTAVLADAAEY